MSGATFPDEPFACPHCGQMLAATCRVCVACKREIDPGEIQRPPLIPAELQPELSTLSPTRVKFPWALFLVLLAARLWVAMTAQKYLGLLKSELVLGGVELLTGVWVTYDAWQKGVPKPFRWGAGSLFLWTIVFPWYLARRRMPRASCPFVEGRALIVVALMAFILAIVLVALNVLPVR